MAKHPEHNEPKGGPTRISTPPPVTNEPAPGVYRFGQTDEADAAKRDTPAAKPVPLPPASTTPSPVPPGAEPNIQRYDDGRSPRDIGLNDANADALNGAGLGNVGRIRRVRDVDLTAIDGVDRAMVREKVPFQVRKDEVVLVPDEEHPGEWVNGEGRDNKSARRL